MVSVLRYTTATGHIPRPAPSRISHALVHAPRDMRCDTRHDLRVLQHDNNIACSSVSINMMSMMFLRRGGGGGGEPHHDSLYLHLL